MPVRQPQVEDTEAELVETVVRSELTTQAAVELQTSHCAELARGLRPQRCGHRSRLCDKSNCDTAWTTRQKLYAA